MYHFEILGPPTYQKQTRFNRNGSCYDPSSKEKQRIQWAIKPHAPSMLINCPIEMTQEFYLPIPKASPKTIYKLMLSKTIMPTKKPDIDNMAYIITNALKGIVYQDDNLICILHLYKFYSDNPRTVIKINLIDPQ